jgi:hypothetical protein
MTELCVENLMQDDKADKNNQLAFLQSILSQIRVDDPEIRWFIKQQFGQPDSEEFSKEGVKEISRRLKIQNKKLLEQVALLKEQLQKSRSEKDELTTKLDALMQLHVSISHALGSCPVCLGLRGDCKKCGGKGSTGWRRINKRLFDMYILPAQMKLERSNKK